MHLVDTVRKYLGWCPLGFGRKPGQYTAPAFGGNTKVPAPVVPPIQSPIATASGERREEYQENILLILLLVAGLIIAFKDPKVLAAIVILTAVAVYYDAKNIRAGRNFEKESILGDVITWRPLSWGLLTLVGWIVILAIYLFSRKKIFHANREVN